MEVSIGGGDYDVMGVILLSALVDAGLRPAHTLVDFGCGTGRLARHVVPWLTNGTYVGIDISTTMLAQAQAQLADKIGTSGANVSWLHQTNEEFAIADHSVDMICAFSVFTHMEHEDTYRYLVAAKRIVAPGGCFVASVLTMDLPAAREVFVESASHPLADRWSRVRNITTTYELFASVAELAGWTVERWHLGSEESIPLLGDEQRGVAVGQSIAILRNQLVNRAL